MIIPWQELDADTLNNLLEHFVLQEGTEYGEHDVSLADKVADVRTQLQQGLAVIVYSELHESVNIVPKATLDRAQVDDIPEQPAHCHPDLGLASRADTLVAPTRQFPPGHCVLFRK